jgi:hypothetical protein
MNDPVEWADILISDGAMGTLLHAKVLQGRECPDT